MGFREGTADHDRERHAQIETLLDRKPFAAAAGVLAVHLGLPRLPHDT